MKMKIIQNLTTKRKLQEHILKVQPVKKFMINIKDKKMSFLKKDKNQ